MALKGDNGGSLLLLLLPAVPLPATAPVLPASPSAVSSSTVKRSFRMFRRPFSLLHTTVVDGENRLRPPLPSVPRNPRPRAGEQPSEGDCSFRQNVPIRAPPF